MCEEWGKPCEIGGEDGVAGCRGEDGEERGHPRRRERVAQEMRKVRSRISQE